jgi:2-methylisocitrate lyase-like PEP mutase family enzyme
VQARAIVEATELPVSADLKKEFGDAPEVTAETIRLTAGLGSSAARFENATGNKDRPLYNMGHATERVPAAVRAARALPFPSHPDCAGGELPARRSGSGRQDPPLTGLREGRR